LAVPELVITGICGVVMVKVTLLVPVPELLLAKTLATFVATVVGAPEIKPLVVFTAKPVGKLEAPNEVGPLEAVI
jgi:hypothetical protein